LKFIALKTDDGKIKGKISFYCKALGVSRQSFYDYLNNKDKPWKYELLAAMMLDIFDEDEYNTAYGGKRMREALELKKENKHIDIEIPKLRTIYRIMESLGLTHRPNHNPHGITKADKDARKSDDLLKRDFTSDKPNEKAVTDITECKCKDGKIYVFALFDKHQDYIDECERVEVERKFSPAKLKCGMGLVKAKLEDTVSHVVAMSILLL